jgi:uncharacterized membrane protein
MASLTVWTFQAPDDAKVALKRLQSAASQGIIELADAAIVSWPEGRKRPKTQQLHSMVGAGSVGGAFWGMLFGLLFLVPLVGAAVGAAAGGIAGAFTDIGIDDDFIKQVREQVTPGTSALFVLAHSAVLDKLEGTFEGMEVNLIRTNLSEAQEAELREHFQLVD